MNKESMKKVEEFKKEFGMQELTVDDLDNVGGGVGIGLNTQDSISSFCQLVDVLIITEGLEEAVKIISGFISSSHVIDFIRANGAKGLGSYLLNQSLDSRNDRVNKNF